MLYEGVRLSGLPVWCCMGTALVAGICSRLSSASMTHLGDSLWLASSSLRERLLLVSPGLLACKLAHARLHKAISLHVAGSGQAFCLSCSAVSRTSATKL